LELPVTSSAISPDGKYVAYGDAQGIHVMVRPTGNVKLLPNTSGMVVEMWFPDSTRLLASGGQPFRRWILSILGDRQPGLGVGPGVLSPDGRLRIEIKSEYGGNRRSRVDYWVADASGSKSRRVASFDNAVNAFNFTWVDPSHVVLQRVSAANFEAVLLCLDVRDGRTHVLVKEKTAVLLVETSLPDGRVVYVREPMGQADELWELRVDLDSGELRSDPRQVTKFGEQIIEALSATSDGKTILLQLMHAQEDVYVGRLSSDNTHLTTPVRLTLDDRNDVPTAWIPDGRRVIFDSDRSGSSHIYTQGIDSPTPELVVAGEGEQLRPRVTPDKQWILYTSRLPGSKVQRLMRSPIEGGPGLELATGGDFASIRCGLRALCVIEQYDEGAFPPRTITYRLDPMAGRKERLFTRPAGDSDIAVSPDGSQIAYLVAPDCENCSQSFLSIRVVSLTGRTQQEIPTPLRFSDSGFSSLYWAPDARGFFVGASADNGSGRLYFVGLSGTLHVLWQTPVPLAPGLFWGVPSPDGRYLSIRAEPAETNLWSLEEPE